MKLVINIHEKDYQSILNSGQVPYDVVCAIMNGKLLPKGHGDLKDINAIRQKLMIWDYKVNAIPNYAWKCIEDAPIIIEADGGGEDGVSN